MASFVVAEFSLNYQDKIGIIDDMAYSYNYMAPYSKSARMVSFKASRVTTKPARVVFRDAQTGQFIDSSAALDLAPKVVREILRSA